MLTPWIQDRRAKRFADRSRRFLPATSRRPRSVRPRGRVRVPGWGLPIGAPASRSLRGHPGSLGHPRRWPEGPSAHGSGKPGELRGVGRYLAREEGTRLARSGAHHDRWRARAHPGSVGGAARQLAAAMPGSQDPQAYVKVPEADQPEETAAVPPKTTLVAQTCRQSVVSTLVLVPAPW